MNNKDYLKKILSAGIHIPDKTKLEETLNGFVPTNDNEPHQQIVTDENGEVKWAERTHYTYSELIVILPEITITDKKSAVVNNYAQFNHNFVEGHTYNVIYNGVEYKSTAYFSNIMSDVVLGNESLIGFGGGENTGEPFYFNCGRNIQMAFVYFANEGNHVISINDGCVEKVSSLNESFFPTTVPVIRTAAIGQTIVVKSVDENGKPTEWEAVDNLNRYVPFHKNGNEVSCALSFAEAEAIVTYLTNTASASLNINKMNSGILEASTYYSNSITFGIVLGEGTNAWLRFEFILPEGSVTYQLNPDETVVVVEE